MKFGFSSSSSRPAFALLVLIGVAACSPNPVSRVFEEPNRDFGPKRADGALPASKLRAERAIAATALNWKGEIETARWNRMSEDLAWLSLSRTDLRLGLFSARMANTLRKGRLTFGFTVGDSAYTSAAIGETREESKAKIADGVAMLNRQKPIISALVIERNSKMEWPKTPVTLTQTVEIAEQFMKALADDVQNSELDPAVKKQIVQEIRVNFGPRLARVRVGVESAYRETKAHLFLGKIRKILEDEAPELTGSTAKKLKDAEQLLADVERINNARSALRVLVDFWSAASPEIRETKFKTMAPDFYEYLDGKSPSELRCVRDSCDFIDRIAKAIFILPKIEEFGVKKIKTLLQKNANPAVVDEVEKETTKLLPGLHNEVIAQVVKEIDRQRDNITKVGDEYEGYVRLVMNRMARAKFGLKDGDRVTSFEPAKFYVDLDFAESAVTHAAALESSALDGVVSNAEAIGTGMALGVLQTGEWLDKALMIGGMPFLRTQQVRSRLIYEQLNKVLMVGGFKTENGAPLASLSVAVDSASAGGSTEKRLNLRALTSTMSDTSTFAVPDSISISIPQKPADVVATVIPAQVKVSARGQAELLRGLSRTARLLRDWEKTPFDAMLGSVSFADYLPDLPREAANQKLFPKDMMFAAAIGNAAVLLQNISKPLSTVALIRNDRQIRWVNEMLTGQPKGEEQRATMAAVFDLVDGARATTAQTRDVAAFLSALVEFVRATEDIELSQSALLRARDSDGERPIDRIATGIADVRLLIMATANFLSSEMRAQDGLIRPTYETVPSGHATGEPKLEDQAAVIRALLDAADVLSASVYRAAAIDLMAAVNVQFFNEGFGFYSELRATVAPELNHLPPPDTIVSILVAGERLKPFLPPDHVTAWGAMAAPWWLVMQNAGEQIR